MMEINKNQWAAIGVAIGVVIVSLFFMGTNLFFIVMGIGVIIGVTPFVYLVIRQNKINSEKEEMFLEFARNLVESVKTGTPISKSIINVKNKSYGVLSPHINKLVNQISLGIPLNTALQTFSKDVNNKIIARSLTLIGQAERAGGDIGRILESVAGAVSMTDKLKKERRAAISSLVIQGYIIFFVFMIIILVMQFYIIPMISGIANIGTVGGLDLGQGSVISQDEISSSFLYLLLIQGFFSGLVIGKLAEGNIKAGIKHSFALMFSAFLISTVANIILGG
ncbi:MAG: type II secretion system F family protein [Nanoarchaeota archaeon]|nr:type II secretion system F family protein [Nanoarchaeota archaeon]